MTVLAQSSATGTHLESASTEESSIKILGLDSTSFPKINVTLFISSICALAGNLKDENFRVMEDGKYPSIDTLYFSGNSSGRKLDFGVVFDSTGSMNEEVSSMKSKVKDLTGAFKASEINATYALVSFRDSISVKEEWTDNPDHFQRIVNSLQTDEGDDEPEVSLDAIAALMSMGSRADAEKIVLVITDAHAHYKNDGSNLSNYTAEDIKNVLKDSGAMFILISPAFKKSSDYVDLREIANETQGIWIDINSANMSEILKQVQDMLTGTYALEYMSSDQTPASNRTVIIDVNESGCIRDSVEGFYISPGNAAIRQQTQSAGRRVFELSISGRVFDDSSSNGGMGHNEAGLEGWKVRLADGPGSYSTTTTTDQDGFYSFTGLLPGNYTVIAVMQDGWKATNPKKGTRTVEVVDDHRSEINFGFRASGTES